MLIVPGYDPYNPFPLDENQGFDKYLQLESSIMDDEDYERRKSRHEFRCRALIVIFKYSNCENYDPLVSYLALNYFDRFIANGNRVPNIMSSFVHNLELTIICCLTLAWKVRSRNFKISKYQAEKPKLRDITLEQFMEVEFHILQGLNWDLRVITAICFVPFYAASMFGSTNGFHKRTVHDIIINSHQSNSVKKSKPSVIAASALIAASFFVYPGIFATYRHELSSNGVIGCVGRMIKLCTKWNIISGTDDKPTRKVQDSEPDTSARTPEQESVENSELQFSMEISEQSTEQEEDPDEKFMQREGKQVVTTSDTSLAGAADNKGKSIVVEEEERSLEEESEEMQWNFPLRWTAGEDYGGLIDIFQPPSEIEPAVDSSDQDEPLPVPSLHQLSHHQHMEPNPYELTLERQALEVAAQQALQEAQNQAQKVHHGQGKCLLDHCFCCVCCCGSSNSSNSSFSHQPLIQSLVNGALNNCCCCKSCNLL
ncbi:uncharacterized protein LOC133784228 isoform X2 [Humulus lupulus]|uniref:uncharacterized protein LOC133784228 isoform X2 n=1 Tax=Humulus lupulus TaxID=3486 RepID=UPI002B40EED8|nr:uncharacterized protein LOC133784228 isoform X2 [Humulus lupulus]